jgi:hypothetical protein
MAIVAADIKFILSGGASNTDPNAALGGAISTQAGAIITTDTLNNVWDNVNGAESSSGDTEYRAIFVKNTHGTLTYTGAKIWISSNTTSADDTIEIALADEGINNTIETVGNESTAPTGPSFSAPTSFGTGLTLGNLAAGQAHGVWIKRIVSASAQAANANPYTLSVQGETAA